MTYEPDRFYRRCQECRQPIKSSGQPTKQRFDYANRRGPLNNQRDVIYDHYPRPYLPPHGYGDWCPGHEEKAA